MSELFKMTAPCLLGMESLAAEELKAMGAQEVSAENGRVFFSGNEEIAVRANINSRYSERIQFLISEFQADSFDRLFEGVKAAPWEKYIGARDAFPVKGYSLRSKLFSVPDCQSIVKKAVAERLKTVYHIEWFEETGPVRQIQFSLMKDRALIMLDISGTGLHKRGYRPASNEAPIKETLAAALAKLSRMYDDSVVHDPFCGSGTILIESVMLAANIAPGLGRVFSGERWESVLPQRIWTEERERAKDLEKRGISFRALGSDIDPRAVELSRENARRAGVLDFVGVETRDVKVFSPEGRRGIVICNPPYGERLLDLRQAQELYRIMGERFEKRPGWRYNIISADETFEDLFGRKSDKRRKLYNGMIKCQLYMYYKS